MVENFFTAVLKGLESFAGSLIVLGVTIAALLLSRLILTKTAARREKIPFRRQITTLLIAGLGLFLFIVFLPIDKNIKEQVLSILGILLSAVIALSSTSFVGNAMAGFMLRIIRGYKPGDFIYTGDVFGRVTEQGLFHTEVQTVQRDLITVPNLFMIRNPIRVIRSSGTFVSVKLSLSYDVPRQKAEDSLIKAAEVTELEEPFVFINGLEDHTVEYEVFGLLKETKHYLSVKSGLRKNVLDRLHEDGVEVLSPLFVSTRDYPPDSRFAPSKSSAPAGPGEDEAENSALELAFDKAEEAESIEKLKELKNRILREQEAFEKGEDTGEKPDRKSIEERRKQARRKTERIDEIISEREERKSTGSEDDTDKPES
jgi:small-conductance mechanosensitive channel